MSSGTYVTAGFKTNRENEAFIFMQHEYVYENYAPGQTDDKILAGPAYVRDDFASLKCTIFGELGIDCAFASHDAGYAYLFSGNMCAKWYYGENCSCPSKRGNTAIVDGPKPIVEMFPYLKDTVFADGVDAAFESSICYEAYLFKGDQYARINYSSGNGKLMHKSAICETWPCFRGTTYEKGFEAAFASHRQNEAYVFKGDSYARIKFTPGVAKDVLLNSGKIKDCWKGLGSILPRKNANCQCN